MSWEVDADPAVWFPVPDLDEQDDADGWLDRAVRAVVADFSAGSALPAEYPEVLRYQLQILLQMAHDNAARYGMLLAHLPAPDRAPMPVFVCFREPEQESPDYLLTTAGARGLPALEPPIVEHIVTDDLGEGIRVIRYEDDEELGVVANLCFAWRAHGSDVFIFAQSDELERLTEMHPDLLALASSIRPVAEPAGD